MPNVLESMIGQLLIRDSACQAEIVASIDNDIIL